MKINLDNLKNKNKMKNVILTCLLTFTVISLSFAQLKVVAPDGNVGIGTSTPTAKLQVDGITRILPAAPGDAAIIQVGAGRDVTGLSFIDMYPFKGGGWVGRLESNDKGVTSFSHNGVKNFNLRTFKTTAGIYFGTAFPNEGDWNPAISILPNGSAAFGTLSPDPAAKLTVNGAAVKPGGGAWGVFSDARIKNVSKEYGLGLDAVLELNPVVFQYNGKGGISDTETEYVGLIAQEYQKIAPDAVTKYEYVQRTFEGESQSFKKGTTEEYLKIDPSQITYMLVNAIKEQQETIKNLTDKVEEMSKVGFAAPAATDHVHYSTVVLNGEEEKAMLAQNAPNPFTKNTKIDYFVPSNSRGASMSFTDITGKEVKRISINHTGLGTLDVSIADMPIGIYSYSLVIDGSPIASKKMVLSK